MSVIIRLQGLPWSASAMNIRHFFSGLTIPAGGVHIIGGDGGDAFIAFSSDDDARMAMKKNMCRLNDHPIQLFLSSKAEMQSVIDAARSGGTANSNPSSAPPPQSSKGNAAMDFQHQQQQQQMGANFSQNLGSELQNKGGADFMPQNQWPGYPNMAAGDPGMMPDQVKAQIGNPVMGQSQQQGMGGVYPGGYQFPEGKGFNQALNQGPMGGQMNQGSMATQMNQGMVGGPMGGPMGQRHLVNQTNQGPMSGAMNPGPMGGQMNQGPFGGRMNHGPMGGPMNQGTMGGPMNQGPNPMGSQINQGSMGNQMNQGLMGGPLNQMENQINAGAMRGTNKQGPLGDPGKQQPFFNQYPMGDKQGGEQHGSPMMGRAGFSQNPSPFPGMAEGKSSAGPDVGKEGLGRGTYMESGMARTDPMKDVGKDPIGTMSPGMDPQMGGGFRGAQQAHRGFMGIQRAGFSVQESDGRRLQDSSGGGDNKGTRFSNDPMELEDDGMPSTSYPPDEPESDEAQYHGMGRYNPDSRVHGRYPRPGGQGPLDESTGQRLPPGGYGRFGNFGPDRFPPEDMRFRHREEDFRHREQLIEERTGTRELAEGRRVRFPMEAEEGRGRLSSDLPPRPGRVSRWDTPKDEMTTDMKSSQDQGQRAGSVETKKAVSNTELDDTARGSEHEPRAGSLGKAGPGTGLDERRSLERKPDQHFDGSGRGFDSRGARFDRRGPVFQGMDENLDRRDARFEGREGLEPRGEFDNRMPRFEGRVSRFDKRDPGLEGEDLGMGERGPEFEANRRSTFEGRHPEFDDRGAEFDSRRPEFAFEGRGRLFESRGPGFEGRRPGFEGRDPGFEGRGPGFEGRGPGFEGRGPGFEGRGPGFEGRGRGFEGRGPGFDERSLGYESRGPGFQGRGMEERDFEFERRRMEFNERGPEFEGRGPRFENRGLDFDRRGPPFDDQGSEFERRAEGHDHDRMEMEFEGRGPGIEGRRQGMGRGEEFDERMRPGRPGLERRAGYQYEGRLPPEDGAPGPRFEGRRGPGFEPRPLLEESSGPVGRFEGRRGPSFEGRPPPEDGGPGQRFEGRRGPGFEGAGNMDLDRRLEESGFEAYGADMERMRGVGYGRGAMMMRGRGAGRGPPGMDMMPRRGPADEAEQAPEDMEDFDNRIPGRGGPMFDRLARGRGDPFFRGRGGLPGPFGRGRGAEPEKLDDSGPQDVDARKITPSRPGGPGGPPPAAALQATSAVPVKKTEEETNKKGGLDKSLESSGSDSVSRRDDRSPRRSFERDQSDRGRRYDDRRGSGRDDRRYDDRNRYRYGRDRYRRSRSRSPNRSRDRDRSSPRSKPESRDKSLCLKGMPMSATFKDVRRFLQPVDIPYDGLKLINDGSGQRTGVAYVQLRRSEDIQRALRRSGDKIGSSPVTITTCTDEEFTKAVDSFVPPKKDAPSSTTSGSDNKSQASDKPANSEKTRFIIQLKNLPQSITKQDIVQFLKGVNIENNGEATYIEFDGLGVATGMGYVEVKSDLDHKRALAMDNLKLGTNAVKVSSGKIADAESLKSKQLEMLQRAALRNAAGGKALLPLPPRPPLQPPQGPARPSLPASTEQKSASVSVSQDGNSSSLETVCVHIQGLPLLATPQDIRQFFSDCQILQRGINIAHDSRGKPLGEGFVEFMSRADFDKALKKDKTSLGRHIVAVKPIAKKEMQSRLGISTASGQSSPTKEVKRDQPSPATNTITPQQQQQQQPGTTPTTQAGGPSHTNGAAQPRQPVPQLQQPPPSQLQHQRPIRPLMHFVHNRPPGMVVGPGASNKSIPAGVLNQNWFYVRCQNFPPDISISDILQFFHGFRPIGDSIRLHYSSDGKPTGNAVVGFASREEAQRALSSLNTKPCRHNTISLFPA